MQRSTSRANPKFKELEQQIKYGINNEAKFKYKTSFYIALGAAAVGIVAFLVMKNKKSN
jgi:hypothetical protein